MPTLPTTRIAELLQPYYPALPDLCQQLSLYLDLLLKWNARTNLTAIRDPEQIVTRHFGESLFLAAHIPAGAKTLLDLGSGAGFPGLPVQLALPDLQVTLAESQNKKSAFLQEAVRVLGLPTQVWPGRAETLPADHRFDCVALRAVDKPDVALQEARARTVPGGLILHLAGTESTGQDSIPVPGGSTVLKMFHVEHSGERATGNSGTTQN